MTGWPGPGGQLTAVDNNFLRFIVTNVIETMDCFYSVFYFGRSEAELNARFLPVIMKIDGKKENSS